MWTPSHTKNWKVGTIMVPTFHFLKLETNKIVVWLLVWWIFCILLTAVKSNKLTTSAYHSAVVLRSCKILEAQRHTGSIIVLVHWIHAGTLFVHVWLLSEETYLHVIRNLRLQPTFDGYIPSLQKHKIMRLMEVLCREVYQCLGNCNVLVLYLLGKFFLRKLRDLWSLRNTI